MFIALVTPNKTDLILTLIIIILVFVSGILALAETSLVRMSKAKALALQDQGRRGANTLIKLVSNPEDFLNPVLLLVLLSQLIAATLVGVVADNLFGPLGVVFATIFEIIVIFVLAEAVPKNWAVRNSEKAALFSAPLVAALIRFPPIYLVSNLLIGLSNLVIRGKGRALTFVSEQELLALADVAVEEEVIEGEERTLIRSIIEFGDTVVREVMLPRPDMVAVAATQSVEEVMEIAISAGFSRIPVFGEGIDDVIGIVYTKDLIKTALESNSQTEVGKFVRSAHFVPETKRVSELMREMQQSKFHMAVVVDEYGGTAGLVTLEDLIEELIGEIIDEFDTEEPGVETLENGEIRVNGRMAIDEVNEIVHTKLPSGDWDSIGGLVFNLLGHVPSQGESVEVDGFSLTAEKIQGRRIGRVRITRINNDQKELELES